MISVFGTRPANSIWLGDQPYAVRNDCQSGQWKIGDDDFRGKQIEISIIKVARYFGSLGKATNTFWLQIWFVPAPSCDSLPQNIVCVTYLKTRSLSRFSQKITELMSVGEPALGIFTAGFEKHTNDLGTYYSVKWDWRERKTEPEFEQLRQIEAFLQSEPVLIDLVATKNLTSTDGMTSAQVTGLIQSLVVEKLLP